MKRAPPGAASQDLAKGVLFKILADESPRPTLITDSKARIAYVNRAWEKQFGYAFREVKGKNPRILQSGKTPPQIYQKMWKALKAGKAFQSDEVIDRRKNGRVFNLFTTAFPITVERRAYYVQILDDITKRKKLQEYQSAFIKIAAHDIRSPLAGVQLMSELLAKRMNDAAADGLGVDMKSLHDEVLRASKLVSTLLDISLFETGKVKLRVSDVRLYPLVNEVLKHARSLAPAQKFSAYCRKDCKIRADGERIRQVLVNLVENAIKYAPGRPVAVSVARKRDAVVVSVLDRGPGITKKAAAHIFQIFYRTAQAKKAKTAGHGLGLHIAHKIIQAHHGRLWVSPRTGGGSVFSFTLPNPNLK